MPGNLVALVAALGVFLLWIDKIKSAKILLSVLLIILCFVTFLPLGDLLIYPLEKHFKMEPELPDQFMGLLF